MATQAAAPALPSPAEDQAPEAQLQFLLPPGTTHIDLSLSELDLILAWVENLYHTAPRDDMTTTLLLAIKPVCRILLTGMAMRPRAGWLPVPRVQRGEDVNLVTLRYIARMLLTLAARHMPQLDLAPLLAVQAYARAGAVVDQAQAPAEGEGEDHGQA